MKYKSGLYFTLIELLITISIIAILAALLVSGLGSAFEEAAKTACKNNLKSIGVAQFEYAGENRGKFTYSSDVNKSWDDLLSEYDGRDLSQKLINYSELINQNITAGADNSDDPLNHELYLCAKDDGNEVGGDLYRGGSIARTYVMAGEIASADGISLTRISDAANTILITEKFTGENKVGKGGGDSKTASTATQNVELVNEAIYGLHGKDMFNYLFADGSVKGLDYHDTRDDDNINTGMWTVRADD